MKLEVSLQTLKNSNVKFHENPSSSSRVVPCGVTDRRTDMTKLIVAFRQLSKAPKVFLPFYHHHDVATSNDVYTWSRDVPSFRLLVAVLHHVAADSSPSRSMWDFRLINVRSGHFFFPPPSLPLWAYFQQCFVTFIHLSPTLRKLNISWSLSKVFIRPTNTNLEV